MQNLLQCLPVLGLVLTNKRYTLHELLAFPGRYIYPDSIQDEDEEYYNICSKHIDISFRNFFRKTAVLCASASIAGMWPTFQSLFQKTKITALEVKFPYTSEKSNAEFIGNMLLECNIFTHGFLGVFAVEVGMDISDDFITLSRKLLNYRLQQLSDQRVKKSSAQLSSELRMIVQNLEEFNGWAYRFISKVFIYGLYLYQSF